MIYAFLNFDSLKFCFINFILAVIGSYLSELFKKINKIPSSPKIHVISTDSSKSIIEGLLVLPTQEQLQYSDNILQPQILHSRKSKMQQKTKLPTVDDLIVLPIPEQLKFMDNILKPVSISQVHINNLQRKS
ncbi:hypothetical protein CDAR_285561 [Caerostris darwini]|uniref:Uncharacterized protein n=1 Tax=Caerostris darwini TaxID=1538125 RepID=A0AAV4NR33_9ARAC|nr:hypothetical protein CDAR_285561 [Caerostris darwini]